MRAPRRQLPAYRSHHADGWARVQLRDDGVVRGALMEDDEMYVLEASDVLNRLAGASAAQRRRLGEAAQVVYRHSETPRDEHWHWLEEMRLRGKQARVERRRRLGHVSDLPTQLLQSGLGETDPAVATGPFALMDGCPVTPMGANIGIISDKGFTALYGSCEAVELEVESLMNLVNALYTDMTNLQLAVVYLVCNGAGSGDNFEAEGPNDEPLFFGQRTCTRWDDNSGSGGLQSSKSKNEDGSEGELIQGVNDVDIVLSSFSKWVGMYAPTSAGKRIASWQLLTDCFPTGGLTGLAYTNAACWVGSTKYRMKKNGKCKSAKDGGPCAYKYVGKRGKRASPVVADGTCDEESWLPCQAAVGLSSAGTSLFRTLAHEIGHNFGSSHTFDAGGLMSYRTDIPFFDNHQICTNLMQIIDGGQTQRGAETNCDADGEDCCLYNQEPTGVCGDGVVQPGEACDDGNSSDGDGCSAACEVECGFACEKKSEGLRIFSTCTRHCGDGVVQWELGEECDDDSKCCDGCRLSPSHAAECSGECLSRIHI